MKRPTLAPAYACIYHGLCDVARREGYALAIHGSVTTDLDLIAVPWGEGASAPETVVEAIKSHVGACQFNLDEHGKETQEPTLKPHGRLAWKFHFLGGAIDLSIVVPVDTDSDLAQLRTENEKLRAALRDLWFSDLDNFCADFWLDDHHEFRETIEQVMEGETHKYPEGSDGIGS